MSEFFGTGIDLGPIEADWAPRKGWDIRGRYQGTPLQVRAQMDLLARSGISWRHEVNETGGYEVLHTATGLQDGQSETEPLTDQWTLEGNDLERDIWLHPKVKALFAALLDDGGFPNDQYVAVRQDIDSILSGEKKLSAIRWWSGASADTKHFIASLLRGETIYTVGQFVLKNVKVVAPNYSLKPDYSRVGKVMTGDVLVGAYNIPGTIKFNLPAGFWMERTPTVEEEDVDKFKVSREWWNFQDYDSFLYEQALS